MSKTKIGLVGFLVAAALLVGNSASAATAADLQSQINALLAQIASLQGGSSSSAGCYAFTRDLTVGAQGADVTALQNYLASKGYFTASATGFFGPVTLASVKAWQSASGVMPAAGYFGAISRAKYNSMCTPSSTGGSTSGDDDDSGFNAGNGDEATLSNYDTKSGDDTDLEEGQSEGQILDFKFKVEDADVEVQRVQVDFTFAGTNAGENQPWKTFNGAHLMMGSKEIASIDNVDDKDTWSKEGTDHYSIRFNGVGEVVKAGKTPEFTVAMDVNDSVDGSSTSGANDWTVMIDDDSVRALDEAGIDQYVGDNTDTVTVSIDQAGNNAELNVSEADENPDPTVINVSDTETSDWETVGVMQLSADGEDILLNELPITVFINRNVTPADEVYSDVVNDARIVIDGQEYSDFTSSAAGTATNTLTFDLSDEDVVLSDGDDVNVEIQLEFKKQTSYDEGTTVEVEASSTVVDAIDAEGNDNGEALTDTTDQLKGSFEGETHTLRNDGIAIALVSTKATAPVGGDEAQANFEVKFTVTAFGSDFWVEKTAAADSTPDASDGVEFVVESSDGTATTGASVSASLTGGSAKSGDNSYGFKVSEGSTRTFTALVTFDNSGVIGGSGYYRVQLTGISFDADGTAGSESDITTGLEDYQTDDVYVSNTDAQN